MSSGEDIELQIQELDFEFSIEVMHVIPFYTRRVTEFHFKCTVLSLNLERRDPWNMDILPLGQGDHDVGIWIQEF